MPIGVPKVPFKLPGRKAASWIDICTVPKGYNLTLISRLYRERLLFLGQEINFQVGNQLIGLMLFLTMQNDTEEMYLYINSPGGGVRAGMGIYDTMQFVKPEVRTVCLGFAASMGSVILVGGEITKRLAFPRAWVMIHQPSAYFPPAPTSEFILEAEELLKIRETLTMVYVQRTGKPVWLVSEDMERDTFMSAKEAQAYGMIDRIAVKKSGFRLKI
uniref:ATP-dependent Clp protease proteolytic subunit n=1 Tax=Doniophyton anomalum TaxID=41570 RepID=A0A6G5Q9L6_9ASTR|nr:ClpP [Doniophyton anomalum]QBZ37889.1 ClpP [Doniophyton anomalum]